MAAALAYVESRHGADGVERLKTSLEGENATIHKGIILPSARYPLKDLVGVYEAIDRFFGRGDSGLCYALGQSATEYEVTLFHEVFLKIGKLDYWFKLTGATWRSYYNNASTLVPALEPSPSFSIPR